MRLSVARPAARVGERFTDTRPRNAERGTTAAVACLLCLSGAAGLMYQVAWVRLLGLTFGVTTYAISTVLAAFMGGLALGSFFGGRRADTVRHPLLVYGLVELAVGATALLTPWAFGALQGTYAVLSRVVDPSSAPLIAGAVRAALAFAVLLIPTALMGATLPLAVRGVRGTRLEADPTSGDSWAMALLYATNTTGAIVGVLLSGFVLIGAVGLSETITIAATANALAAFGALALHAVHQRRIAHATTQSLLAAESGPGPVAVRAVVADGSPSRERRFVAMALWAFTASGAISLAYEVVWSRILAVLFDSSIYGFVLMLATVLGGIALGGALGGAFTRWRGRATEAATLAFGVLETGIGLAAVLALLAFGTAYDSLLAARGSGSPFERLVRTDLRLMAVLCVVTVLPAALLMGATFPVAARLWAAGSSGLARRLGGIYAGNVAGAIVGSLAAGFLMVPLLGAHLSLLLLAAANVVIGAALLSQVNSRPIRPALTALAALAVIGWAATWPSLHEKLFHEHFP
ncbi:MAG TPA: fused MFS/spermidine synthase, partial [Chloroflexota bacterium]|nr:fused MFS/spermidine synthase [Chloroflexota bacterium]